MSRRLTVLTGAALIGIVILALPIPEKYFWIQVICAAMPLIMFLGWACCCMSGDISEQQYKLELERRCQAQLEAEAAWKAMVADARRRTFEDDEADNREA